MTDKTQVWSWRAAILKAKLEPTTKLVLLALSTYMNDHGGGCYPSITTIAAACSLSERAVTKHLVKAINAGFILKTKRNIKGQQWAANEYLANLPANFEVKSAPVRGEPSAPLESLRDAPRSGEGCTTFHEGVHHVPTNSPFNSPLSKEANPNLLDEAFFEKHFEDFWQTYPKKEGKQEAWLEFVVILRRRDASPEQLLGAAKAYAKKMEGEQKFALLPCNWLGKKRWLDDAPQTTTPASELDKVYNCAFALVIAGTIDGAKERLVLGWCNTNPPEELAARFTQPQKFWNWFNSKQRKHL